jgi:outer membrane receptor protein involved in Fe transport
LTGGAFFQDAHFMASQHLPTNRATVPIFPATLTAGHNSVHIYSYSLFGQARYKVTEQLELAAGARWTDEIRRLKYWNEITGTPILIPLTVTRIQSKRVSPEFTVTYKPQENLTFFGSFKQGWKSGNFNAGAIPAPGTHNDYADEKVVGGEIGMKSRLMGRRLAIDIAAYDYTYSNLQVGISQLTASGIPVALTVNAGKAKVYGAEFSATYLPESIDGLTLNLAAGWNHGTLTEFNNLACSYGQLVSEGCNQVLNAATGRYTAQNLSGIPMIRAPRAQINFGFDYEFPVGQDMNLTIANANNYTSKYLTAPGRGSQYYQPAYFKADLSLTLEGPKDKWELALIGKNINNKLTGSNCSPSNFAFGSVGLTPDLTGGTVRGPGGQAEIACRMDNGRELWLRLTYRPFN